MAAILTSSTTLLPAAKPTAEQVPAGKTATESVAPHFTDQRGKISPGLPKQTNSTLSAITRHLR